MNRRKIGYKGEKIVKQYYEQKGYIFITQNFTTRGGEIDLIFEKGNTIYFIEVKIVDKIDDYMGYITKKKIKSLKKTIDIFLYKKDKYRGYFKKLLFIFVRDNEINHIFEYYT